MKCLVLYEAGKSGTWLAWFINQHNNFPRYDYKEQNRNLDKQVDIACNGADWWPENQSFKENRRLAKEIFSNNTNSTKDCIKILPNHNLFQQNSMYVNRSLLKKYTSDIDKVIIPIVTDVLHDQFLERWKLLLKEKGSAIKNVEILNWQNNNFENYKNLGFEYHFLDIGKLISEDELEYKNLLSFINESPIDNWKELVYNYKKFAFGSYIKEDYDAIQI